MLVLGAGPAGLKAATKLARAGFKIKVFTTKRVNEPEWVVPQEALKLFPDKDVILEKYKEGCIKHLMYGTEIPVKAKFFLLDRNKLLKSMKEEAKADGVTFINKPEPSMKTIVATGSSARRFKKLFYCYGFWIKRKLVDIPTVEIESMKHGFFIYPHEKEVFICAWYTKPTNVYLKELYERACVKPINSQIQHGVVPVEMKTPEENDKLFVGDALSAATPIMGEGLRPALLSAELAAKAISKGENYTMLLKKEFGFAYRFSTFMRDRIWGLSSERMNDIMLKLKTCRSKTIENLVKTKITLGDAIGISMKCFNLFL